MISSSPSCARSSSYRLGLACGHLRPHISSCVAGNTTRKTKGSHRRIKCRMEMENETKEERERRHRRERASWWRTETRRKPKHKPHTTTNTANSSTQPPKSRLDAPRNKATGFHAGFARACARGIAACTARQARAGAESEGGGLNFRVKPQRNSKRNCRNNKRLRLSRGGSKKGMAKSKYISGINQHQQV